MLRDMYSDGKRIEQCLSDYALPEAMLDLIVVIFGLSKHAFDDVAYNQIVKVLRQKCDYTLMTSNAACLYAALLMVLYENPMSKVYPMIELVQVFRDTGFRSRVTNMMALGFLEEGSDPEDRATKTLKLYHAIHQKHGFITGEDDYLAVMYLAGLEKSIEGLIDETESYYHQLAAHSFFKGNALQALSHQLPLLETKDQKMLVDDLDRWYRRFKKDRIKTNSSQIIIYGLLGLLELDEDSFMSGLIASMEESRENNSDHRVHALQRSAIILEEIHQWLDKKYGDEIDPSLQAYVKASLLQLLTSYLFRERLI